MIDKRKKKMTDNPLAKAFSQISNDLLKLLESESVLFNSSIHGIKHWRTVERNGLYLARFTGADAEVVSLFAHFHDCRRLDEGADPEHGPRAAAFLKQHRSLIPR